VKVTYEAWAILGNGNTAFFECDGFPEFSHERGDFLDSVQHRVVRVRVTIETIDTPAPTTPEEGAGDGR
jgi:hypothetical protein